VGAEGDHLQCPIHSCEPREALSPARAGQYADIDFRKSAFCRWHRNPVVAAERQLESCAERRAVNGSDDRFPCAFDEVLQGEHARAARRLAELGDVRADDEGSACAEDHHGAHLGCRERLIQAGSDAVANHGRQGVDWRRVDGEHRDVVLESE
jgi:hypothetical protein